MWLSIFGFSVNNNLIGNDDGVIIRRAVTREPTSTFIVFTAGESADVVTKNKAKTTIVREVPIAAVAPDLLGTMKDDDNATHVVLKEKNEEFVVIKTKITITGLENNEQRAGTSSDQNTTEAKYYVGIRRGCYRNRGYAKHSIYNIFFSARAQANAVVDIINQKSVRTPANGVINIEEGHSKQIVTEETIETQTIKRYPIANIERNGNIVGDTTHILVTEDKKELHDFRHTIKILCRVNHQSIGERRSSRLRGAAGDGGAMRRSGNSERRQRAAADRQQPFQPSNVEPIRRRNGGVNTRRRRQCDENDSEPWVVTEANIIDSSDDNNRGDASGQSQKRPRLS